MIREKLIEKGVSFDKKFRMRGAGEPARIEALSDGVIGFAITLLVVSLEVPRTFDELLVAMRGFLAFAVTFFMIFHVWFVQYKFFRRYGLNDNFTIWTNALLLFVILFYVYPLKFIWTLATNAVVGTGSTVQTATGASEPIVRGEQIPMMFVVYGVGFAAVFLIFTVLYAHAYRKRAELELNELEIYDTRVQVQDNALMALVGLVSIGFAFFGRSRFAVMLAGMVYWLIGPIQFTHGYMMGARRKRLEARLEDHSPSHQRETL